MCKSANLKGDPCHCPSWGTDDPHVRPIDPVSAATDAIADFRRASTIAGGEIAAWAAILHRAPDTPSTINRRVSGHD